MDDTCGTKEETHTPTNLARTWRPYHSDRYKLGEELSVILGFGSSRVLTV